MKNLVKFSALALAAMCVGGAVYAQSAGSVLVRVGAAHLAPAGPSQCMSAPDFGGGSSGCSQSKVSADTQLAGGVTYFVTRSVSVDVPLALPFTHKIRGAGGLEGAGQLGEVQALPATVFVQYRFMQAETKFRPYVGLGATYAYFSNPQGSGRLTAVTNPGGPPTTFTVDSKWTLTPQIGATLALDGQWLLDVVYSKSKLNTTTRLSTGQTMGADLDPSAVGISLAYKF